MKNKNGLLKSVSMIFLMAMFIMSLTSCAVVHNPNTRHDNGLHKGWYKKQHKANPSYYKYQKGPKHKKAKG